MDMTVDTPEFIGSLSEPTRAYALNLVEPKSNGTELPSVSARIDQLELDLRSHFLTLFASGDTADDVSKQVGFWIDTLHLCHHLVFFCETKADAKYKGMSVRKMPMLLLEDAADVLSEDAAMKFWAEAVEASQSVLFSDLMWNKATTCHLPFLKACNKFLKLLRGKWAGRVLWTMARGFGIADKSGMKVWGSFHTDNVTPFLSEAEFTASSNVPNLGYGLYQSFWSLQQDFSNPNGIDFADFLKKIRAVLAALESKTSTTSIGQIARSTDSTAVKFLTSPTLLPMQLTEQEFGVTFLTQYLIISSHLGSESDSLKKKLEDIDKRAKQLLIKHNPEYLALLETILTREGIWRQWKKLRCNPALFQERDEEPPPKPNALRNGPLLTNEAEKGIQEMFEPTKQEDLAAISRTMVEKVPSLEQHLEAYVEALDPEAGIEDAYHPKQDKLYCWRATRLLTKHHLTNFHMMNGPDFEQVVRYVYTQKGSPIPGTASFKERKTLEQVLDGDISSDDEDPEKEAKMEVESLEKENDEKAEVHQEGEVENPDDGNVATAVDDDESKRPPTNENDAALPSDTPVKEGSEEPKKASEEMEDESMATQPEQMKPSKQEESKKDDAVTKDTPGDSVDTKRTNKVPIKAEIESKPTSAVEDKALQQEGGGNDVVGEVGAPEKRKVELVGAKTTDTSPDAAPAEKESQVGKATKEIMKVESILEDSKKRKRDETAAESDKAKNKEGDPKDSKRPTKEENIGQDKRIIHEPKGRQNTSGRQDKHPSSRVKLEEGNRMPPKDRPSQTYPPRNRGRGGPGHNDFDVRTGPRDREHFGGPRDGHTNRAGGNHRDGENHRDGRRNRNPDDSRDNQGGPGRGGRSDGRGGGGGGRGRGDGSGGGNGGRARGGGGGGGDRRGRSGARGRK